MSTDVIAVRADTDQEEVARIASRYDLLAVPVVETPRTSWSASSRSTT